jgi:glucosamine 6-phosphate synthetase-like amidotransferase/phosphosugar isomerase protein
VALTHPSLVTALAPALAIRLVAARHGAGAGVVGLGDGEAYLASDIAAVLVAISQSGETADTLGAVKAARAHRDVLDDRQRGGGARP